MKTLILLISLLTLNFPITAQETDPWTEYITPSKVHQMLANYVGNFEMEITMWMDPAADPMVVKVNSANDTVLGGRFLEMKQWGIMMGMNYKSEMTIGFNNNDNQFALTMLTNMGTDILFLRGSWDEESRIANLYGEINNPVSNTVINVRQEISFIDKDELRIVNYDREGEAPEEKTIQYRFTRKK